MIPLSQADFVSVSRSVVEGDRIKIRLQQLHLENFTKEELIAGIFESAMLLGAVLMQRHGSKEMAAQALRSMELSLRNANNTNHVPNHGFEASPPMFGTYIPAGSEVR